jgi:integrase
MNRSTSSPSPPRSSRALVPPRPGLRPGPGRVHRPALDLRCRSRRGAHGLRHTSATLMLDSGVSPKVAAERLGHADATLFMNLYSHVTPTMQRHAAERLRHALFGEA